MAVELRVLDITQEAGGDLSSDQFKFVKLDSNDQVVACDGATDIPLGVLQNKPDAAGKAAVVRVFGLSKIQADGDIDAPTLIGTSADAQAQAIAAGTDTTVYIAGQARSSDATNAGEIFTAFINCMAPARAA
jgi:hypothetical protein